MRKYGMLFLGLSLLLIVNVTKVKAEEITLAQIGEKLQEKFQNEEGEAISNIDITTEESTMTIKYNSEDPENGKIEFTKVYNYQDGILSYKAPVVEEKLEFTSGLLDNIINIFLIDSILELKGNENTIIKKIEEMQNPFAILVLPWEKFDFAEDGVEAKTKIVNVSESGVDSQNNSLGDFNVNVDVDFDLNITMDCIEEIKIDVARLDITSFLAKLDLQTEDNNLETNGTNSSENQESISQDDPTLPENPATGANLPIISLLVLFIGSISIYWFTKKKGNLFKL